MEAAGKQNQSGNDAHRGTPCIPAQRWSTTGLGLGQHRRNRRIYIFQLFSISFVLKPLFPLLVTYSTVQGAKLSLF